MELKLLLLVPIAFVCEYCDSSLGMGYGTILTPVLMVFFGFKPMDVVPAVLMSEFVTGMAAAFAHHSFRNVRFERRSKDTKVAVVLAACSMVGTVGAVWLTTLISKETLTLIIGIIILSMGGVILVTLRWTPRFSWAKITAVGAVASFNKGLSGGGYGPLVMGGQMLSGVGVKNAIGITSLAEGLTCLVGVVVYAVLHPEVTWRLAPFLMLGALLSVPFAAHTVRRLPERLVKPAVAGIIFVLGCYTLARFIGWA
ncbi:MAG: sulfite exporter TauE/SafE family protein [Verrucomicrobia bacterium]|nr:sulfite exporter TauE/SafE family protein [Verrucomicrobiota bacterium]